MSEQIPKELAAWERGFNERRKNEFHTVINQMRSVAANAQDAKYEIDALRLMCTEPLIDGLSGSLGELFESAHKTLRLLWQVYDVLNTTDHPKRGVIQAAVLSLIEHQITTVRKDL